jgi:hypothetical protein
LRNMIRNRLCDRVPAFDPTECLGRISQISLRPVLVCDLCFDGFTIPSLQSPLVSPKWRS